MPALQKFNRSPSTKNMEDWPPAENAMQQIRQRKVLAMKGLPHPDRDVSFTPAHSSKGKKGKGF